MKAIVAVDKNNVIGINNSIPWNCKPDMQWFKQCTTNGIVVMGSKTFVSIGRPLPNRYNIVLTSKTNKLFQFMGPETEPTVLVHVNPAFTNKPLHILLNELGTRLNKEVWVCGGTQVYNQLTPFCDNIFVSKIPERYYTERLEGTVAKFMYPSTHKLMGMHVFEDVAIERWVYIGTQASPVNQVYEIPNDPDLQRLQYAL